MKLRQPGPSRKSLRSETKEVADCFQEQIEFVSHESMLQLRGVTNI